MRYDRRAVQLALLCALLIFHRQGGAEAAPAAKGAAATIGAPAPSRNASPLQVRKIFPYGRDETPSIFLADPDDFTIEREALGELRRVLEKATRLLSAKEAAQIEVAPVFRPSGLFAGVPDLVGGVLAGRKMSPSVQKQTKGPKSPATLRLGAYDNEIEKLLLALEAQRPHVQFRRHALEGVTVRHPRLPTLGARLKAWWTRTRSGPAARAPAPKR